jgi:hypothetical protein
MILPPRFGISMPCAIGVETGSWPSDDDTRMPNNPKYPREGLGED